MLEGELLEALLQFRRERNWEQFHTVRNLSAALSVEAGELLDHFRWARDFEVEKIVEHGRSEIENELADVTILLAYLYHDLGISMEDAVRRKLEINRNKYPIARVTGSSKKYDKLDGT